MPINTPKNKCKKCWHTISAAAELDGTPTKPGDYSICAYCGEIHIFTEFFTLRELAPDEFIALENNPIIYGTILRIQNQIKENRKSGRSG